MTGFQLKLLAMLCMTADHIGAVLFPGIPLLRWIGRLAMPVFCWGIGEGFRHTRSRRRYLGRLVGLALLSELPFDFAFYGGICSGHQNVFFTLALGLLALWALRTPWAGWPGALLMGLAAELLRCDYGIYGVLLILALDQFRERPRVQAGAVFLLTLLLFGANSQLLAVLAVPLLACYNRRRGPDDHHLFYLYYPLHLCVLGFLRILF